MSKLRSQTVYFQLRCVHGGSRLTPMSSNGVTALRGSFQGGKVGEGIHSTSNMVPPHTHL